MSQRSVVVRLSMEASQYITEAQKAGKVGEDAMERVGRAAKTSDQAIQDIGSTAGKAAAGGLATLFATGKAASDWESAWAGVTKTVEGTPAQLQAVEDGIRDLAKTMPAAHAEIAAVAEAAGQLGVKTSDVVDFTETMIQLGETTNVTADEAATSIAQIQNVMRMAPGDVDNFANALVDLGNKGASTEGEILSMASRVAGAGVTIGASEQDVLALSAAMANLGIESELGGGAMQRVLTKINTGVKSGSADVEKYAQVAGVSAQEFATAWGERPVQAFDMLVQGLGKIQGEGGDVASVLDDMGIKGTQNLQVMLRMAGAGDGLTVALGQSGQAWSENSALVEEYGKRAETTESQVTVAWNRIRDAGIEAGEVLLPIVATVAEGVGAIASAFGSLPDPVQSGVTYTVLALTGAGGLVWATTKVIAAVQATTATMAALGIATEVTGRKMMLAKAGMLGAGGMVAGLSLMADESTTTGKAIETLGLTAGGALMGFAVGGPIGAAIGGGVGLLAGLAKQIFDTSDAAKESSPRIDGLAESFDGLTGSASAATRALVLQKLEASGMLPALAQVGITQRDMIDASLGNEAAITRVNGAIADTRRQGREAMADSDYTTRTWGAQISGAATQAENALKELGLEMVDGREKARQEAVALEDLSTLLRGFPKDVVTHIKQEGLPTSLADVRKLQEQYDLTPKQVKTLIQIAGAEDVVEALRRAKREADSVDGTKSTITIETIRNTRYTTSNREREYEARTGRKKKADGGTVPTTGLGYADRHPYLLADGEEVISNRHGQADRHRPLLKAINAGLLADGGTTGAMSRYIPRSTSEALNGPASFDQALRQLARATDKTSDSMKGLKGKVKDLEDKLDEVRSKRSSLVDSTTSQFALDLFGTGSVWGDGGGSAADRIQDTTADLRDRIRLQRRLKKAGLSKDALAEVLSQGSNDDLQAILNNPGEAKRIQRLYRQFAKASDKAGTSAGRLAYGDQSRQIVRELERLRAEVKRQGKDRRDDADRDRKAADKRSEKNSRDVTAGLNRAASSATRRGRVTI